MLVIIASYPKSGNTWLRVLLANYFSVDDTAADINALPGSSILSSRAEFEESVGLESTHMTREEIDNLRPMFCRNLADDTVGMNFVKVHDIYRDTADGGALFPADAVNAVVYPYRNPFSVCLSYAHHQAKNIDWAISQMDDHEASMFPKEAVFGQLEQYIGTWGEHAASWLDQNDIPVFPVKYEELLASPADKFKQILEFLGEYPDWSKIHFAVEKSTIRQLQKQEEEKGFFEKNPASGSFFRSGSATEWIEKLNDDQVKQLAADHENMIERLDYGHLVEEYEQL